MVKVINNKESLRNRHRLEIQWLDAVWDLGMEKAFLAKSKEIWIS